MHTTIFRRAMAIRWPEAKASVDPCQRIKKKGHIPVPTSFTTGVIAAAAILPPTLIAAVTTPGNPGAQDVWCAVGAGVATVITAITARQKDKSLGHMICVILASFFVGIIVPSAGLWSFHPELAVKLIWSAWCFLGFAAGLMGWAAAFSIMKYGSKAVEGFTKKNARRVEGWGPNWDGENSGKGDSDKS